MKLAVLAAAVATLSTSGPRIATEIRFDPAEGLVLEKTFTTLSETESEGDRSSTSGSFERTLVVVDEYEAVDEQRVTRLVRTYEEISGESENRMTFGDRENESSGTISSDVEGATVAFTWDEDDEEYRPSSDDLDDEVLPRLLFDLDFTALLPEGEVEEGDSWSLDGETYQVVMDPWGELPYDYETSDGQTIPGKAEDDEFAPETDESHDGELVVTFAGTREEDGVTVAVLELEGELETERTVAFSRETERGQFSTHSEIHETRTLSGEALWDLEAGHLSSLELEVEVHGEEHSVRVMQFGEGEREFESDSVRDGTITIRAEFRPAE
jgi:hypothetical protein